jgi:hypothetical protein
MGLPERILLSTYLQRWRKSHRETDCREIMVMPPHNCHPIGYQAITTNTAFRLYVGSIADVHAVVNRQSLRCPQAAAIANL